MANRLKSINFKIAACFIILFSVLSRDLSAQSSKYYYGKRDVLFGMLGTYYVLGEKKNDSLKLTHISFDEIQVCYYREESETLPFSKSSGQHFKIKKARKNKIKVRLFSGTKTRFTLKRNEKQFHIIKNEAASHEIEIAYKDSLKRIYRSGAYDYLSFHPNNKSYLIDHCPSDTFPAAYIKDLDKSLLEARAEMAQKKKQYETLQQNPSIVDSLYFKKFLKENKTSYYDCRMLYIILCTKPEFYFWPGENPARYSISSNNFSKAELQQMYCTLKKVVRLHPNPNDLWEFEHEGTYNCEQK